MNRKLWSYYINVSVSCLCWRVSRKGPFRETSVKWWSVVGSLLCVSPCEVSSQCLCLRQQEMWSDSVTLVSDARRTRSWKTNREQTKSGVDSVALWTIAAKHFHALICVSRCTADIPAPPLLLSNNQPTGEEGEEGGGLWGKPLHSFKCWQERGLQWRGNGGYAEP